MSAIKIFFKKPITNIVVPRLKELRLTDNLFAIHHYSQIIIHWLVALLVFYQFTFGGNIEFLELESCINSKTNDLKSCQHLNNHYLVGVIIFLLMGFCIFFICFS